MFDINGTEPSAPSCGQISAGTEAAFCENKANGDKRCRGEEQHVRPPADSCIDRMKVTRSQLAKGRQADIPANQKRDKKTVKRKKAHAILIRLYQGWDKTIQFSVVLVLCWNPCIAIL